MSLIRQSTMIDDPSLTPLERRRRELLADPRFANINPNQQFQIDQGEGQGNALPTSVEGYGAIFNNPEMGDSGPQYNLNDPEQARQALTGWTRALDGGVHPNTGNPENTGTYYGTYDTNGKLIDVAWRDDSKSGWFKQNMGIWGPLLVGGAAALGAGAAAAGGSAAGASSTAAGQAGLDSLIAGLGPQNGLNLTALNGMNYATGAAAAGAMDTAGLDALIAELGPANGLDLTALNGMNYAAPAAAGVQAATPAKGGAAAGGASLFKDVGQYASAVGPALSLLSGGSQMAALPQNPEAPRIPGAEAPPEARGYQAGVAPILDVLGRNQRGNRNQTLLTGPRGVNMASTRARGNSLLGL